MESIILVEDIIIQVTKLQVFSQFWTSIFLLVPLVLIARTVVAGTRYSPILLVVVFGLSLGFIMVATGVSTPGLPEFQIVDLLSRTTIIALIASFFVGGQELRKVFGKLMVEHEDLVSISKEEASVGTNKTQFAYIFHSFFLLLGIEAAYRAVVGIDGGALTTYYPLLAYIGIAGSIIILDYKSILKDKKIYIRKGILETLVICTVLVITFHISTAIRPIIALPQIFFAMLIMCSLGAVFYKWALGPTLRSLLFAGLPMVLAANFLIGGSRISEAFGIPGMTSVLAFGFAGQLVWMFGGISIIMIFAKTAHVRNLAPALAGGLSHAGLTGACTAGDLGHLAQSRTPIMINLPFLAHVFVFSILAISAERGSLVMGPALAVLLTGALLTVWSLKTLRAVETVENMDHKDSKEIKGLMKFALGWQLFAMFGSFVLLSVFGMNLNHVAVAATSSLSHFGLFAATQGGMFGIEVAELLPFIFAMPFLVHPFVFFLFGKAMGNNGEMPKTPAFALAGIGVLGIVYSIIAI